MGQTDTVTKDFLSDNQVFADVCNYFLKKQLVDPAALKEFDTTEIYIPTILDESDDSAQKYRDVMKECAIAMADDKVNYVLFGIENQTAIDYSMVARTYIYDAMRYSKQLRDIAGTHTKEKNGSGYLSRFHKEDRLKPVVTIVVYYGNTSWDAALDLYDMFGEGYDELYSLIDNYSIKVLEASKLTDEEIAGFRSSLQQVMKFIKYSDDADKLQEVLETDAEFHSLDRRAACVIQAVTKTKIEIRDEEEEIDMCKAIQDMNNRSRTEGWMEGKMEGKMEGVTEGMVLERQNIVRTMFSVGATVETIAALLKTSVEEINNLLDIKTQGM